MGIVGHEGIGGGTTHLSSSETSSSGRAGWTIDLEDVSSAVLPHHLITYPRYRQRKSSVPILLQGLNVADIPISGHVYTRQYTVLSDHCDTCRGRWNCMNHRLLLIGQLKPLEKAGPKPIVF